MIDNLLYTIPKENHTKEQVKEILTNHPEIKFVSFVGIDLSGNDTDEKIPVNLFLDDLDSLLHGVAVQTDGSSVVLPGIATLNNAKVDMIADLHSKWFVDYNYDFIDSAGSQQLLFNSYLQSRDTPCRSCPLHVQPRIPLPNRIRTDAQLSDHPGIRRNSGFLPVPDSL